MQVKRKQIRCVCRPYAVDRVSVTRSCKVTQYRTFFPVRLTVIQICIYRLKQQQQDVFADHMPQIRSRSQDDAKMQNITVQVHVHISQKKLSYTCN